MSNTKGGDPARLRANRASGARSKASGAARASSSGADFGEASPRRAECVLEFENLARRELELLGEDPARAGLVKTPARIARALLWLTRGY